MKTHRILLLNATYEPLMVIGWQKAVTMLWLEKVEPLVHYDAIVHSVNYTIVVPAVVRLLSRVKSRPPTVRFSRANVYARDRYSCQYCGDQQPGDKLTYDHVIPKSQGGRTNWQNIVTCCVACNRDKGGRTPRQAGMKLLRKPVKPRLLPSVGRNLTPMDPPEAWTPFLWS